MGHRSDLHHRGAGQVAVGNHDRTALDYTVTVFEVTRALGSAPLLAHQPIPFPTQFT